MEVEDIGDVVVVDPSARATELGGDPAGLTRALAGRHVCLSTGGVGEDQPHEPGADHEPDDQQPPVELGVHDPESTGKAARAAATPPYTPQP